MTCKNPRCMGNYNFQNIVFYAKKRFVDGCKTIELLTAAKTDREREEIALVSLLDVKEDTIQEMHLSCSCSGQCQTIDCREKLKKMIEEELANKACRTAMV